MRQMFSKKQLIELISKYSGKVIEVSDVKSLNDEQCNSLKCGDIVAKKTGEQYHCYIVTYKEANQGLCLSYFDASVVETQSYDYTDGHWVYNSEDKTEFADIGGLPDVTSDDNGKVLEVITGAWGIGGKKVRRMPAPTSTTLTDAEIEQITGGAFIEGNFLGYKNPILCPSSLWESQYLGFIIASGGTNRSGCLLGTYRIDASTKKITLHRETFYWQPADNIFTINGKLVPNSFPTTGFSCYRYLDGSKIGAVTSTAVGSMYKNAIAISDDALANAVDVKVRMSNNAVYPAINNPDSDEVVIFSGLDFQTGSLSVTAIYYQ